MRQQWQIEGYPIMPLVSEYFLEPKVNEIDYWEWIYIREQLWAILHDYSDFPE